MVTVVSNKNELIPRKNKSYTDSNNIEVVVDQKELDIIKIFQDDDSSGSNANGSLVQDQSISQMSEVNLIEKSVSDDLSWDDNAYINAKQD